MRRRCVGREFVDDRLRQAGRLAAEHQHIARHESRVVERARAAGGQREIAARAVRVQRCAAGRPIAVDVRRARTRDSRDRRASARDRPSGIPAARPDAVRSPCWPSGGSRCRCSAEFPGGPGPRRTCVEPFTQDDCAGGSVRATTQPRRLRGARAQQRAAPRHASVAPVVITSSTMRDAPPPTRQIRGERVAHVLRARPPTAARPAPACRVCAAVRRSCGTPVIRATRRAISARLVEAAFALAGRRERQRDQHVGPRRPRRTPLQRVSQSAAAKVGVRQPAAILECVQQPVDRKRVDECGERVPRTAAACEAHAPQTEPAGCGSAHSGHAGRRAAARVAGGADQQRCRTAPRRTRIAGAARADRHGRARSTRNCVSCRSCQIFGRKI